MREPPDATQFFRPSGSSAEEPSAPAAPDRPLPAPARSSWPKPGNGGRGPVPQSPIRFSPRYRGVQMTTASAGPEARPAPGLTATPAEAGERMAAAQSSAAGGGGSCGGGEDPALHAQITSAWRLSPVIHGSGDPDVVAKCHTYSLDKQLLILLQATESTRTRMISRTPRTRSGALNATAKHVNRRGALLRTS